LQKAKPGYKLVKSLFGKYEEIPEDWNFQRFGKIGEIIGGGTPKSDEPEFWNGNVLWAVPTDITNQSSKFISDTERHISKKGLDSSSAKLLPVGSLLITTRATIGECSIASKEIATNQGFQNLVCNGENFNEFWYYVTQFHKNKFLRLSHGTTFLEINKNWMKQILIPTTKSKNEQQKITSILSNVDKLISSYEKTIQSTKKLKKGLMQTLLTRGIGHKKFKKVKWLFGKEMEIPEKWEITNLKNLVKPEKFSIVDGPFGTQLHSEDYEKEGIPLMNVSNITKEGKFNHENIVFISPEKFKELIRSKIIPGDLFLAKTGATIGKITVFPNKWKEGLVSSRCAKITLDPSKAYNYFIFYILFSKFGFSQIISRATATTMPGINLTDISKLKIIFPISVEEQQKIVSILSSVDDDITKLELKKKSAESLKKGLMQKLLTGQIRVTV
jgi:type I restriction enzyme, S subunit